MEVIIAIDDLHPEKGWGCEGDESIGYLEQLNQEFGCKFTLFIPANYHEDYPISKHKDWVDWWLSKSWAEIASHGYYHKVFKYTFLEPQSLLLFVSLFLLLFELHQEKKKLYHQTK